MSCDQQFQQLQLGYWFFIMFFWMSKPKSLRSSHRKIDREDLISGLVTVLLRLQFFELIWGGHSGSWSQDQCLRKYLTIYVWLTPSVFLNSWFSWLLKVENQGKGHDVNNHVFHVQLLTTMRELFFPDISLSSSWLFFLDCLLWID